jgi:hypothetical protein
VARSACASRAGFGSGTASAAVDSVTAAPAPRAAGQLCRHVGPLAGHPGDEAELPPAFRDGDPLGDRVDGRLVAGQPVPLLLRHVGGEVAGLLELGDPPGDGLAVGLGPRLGHDAGVGRQGHGLARLGAHVGGVRGHRVRLGPLGAGLNLRVGLLLALLRVHQLEPEGGGGGHGHLQPLGEVLRGRVGRHRQAEGGRVAQAVGDRLGVGGDVRQRGRGGGRRGGGHLGRQALGRRDRGQVVHPQVGLQVAEPGGLGLVGRGVGRLVGLGLLRGVLVVGHCGGPQRVQVLDPVGAHRRVEQGVRVGREGGRHAGLAGDDGQGAEGGVDDDVPPDLALAVLPVADAGAHLLDNRVVGRVDEPAGQLAGPISLHLVAGRDGGDGVHPPGRRVELQVHHAPGVPPGHRVPAGVRVPVGHRLELVAPRHRDLVALGRDLPVGLDPVVGPLGGDVDGLLRGLVGPEADERHPEVLGLGHGVDENTPGRAGPVPPGNVGQTGGRVARREPRPCSPSSSSSPP